MRFVPAPVRRDWPGEGEAHATLRPAVESAPGAAAAAGEGVGEALRLRPTRAGERDESGRWKEGVAVFDSSARVSLRWLPEEGRSGDTRVDA